MKKLTKIFAVSLLLLGAVSLIGCASDNLEEEVTSSVSEKHITVDQTKSTVRITLNKFEGEDITEIDVLDPETGCMAYCPMTLSTVTFNWPFAIKGNEYTLCAQIIGSGYSEEYVTFTVTGDVTSDYVDSKKFKDSDIILIAKGNERLIKFETTKADFESSLKKVPSNAELNIAIYSGIHFKAKPTDSTLVAAYRTSTGNKNIFDSFVKGYDIIANSNTFGYSAKELNDLLSANKTYFTVVRVIYEPQGEQYPKGFKFGGPSLSSNDTIYTPVLAEELPNNEIDKNAK